MTAPERIPGGPQPASDPGVRIGLVHAGAATAPDIQEARLRAAGSEVIWRIADDAAGRKQLDQLLSSVSRGSSLVVTGLDAFGRSLPELLRLVRGLLELGVAIEVVEADKATVISPEDRVADALRVIAAFAKGRVQSAASGTGRRPRAAALSEVQIKYARRMFKEGEPMRTIGLILRVAPDDVWEAISKQRSGVEKSG